METLAERSDEITYGAILNQQNIFTQIIVPAIAGFFATLMLNTFIPNLLLSILLALGVGAILFYSLRRISNLITLMGVYHEIAAGKKKLGKTTHESELNRLYHLYLVNLGLFGVFFIFFFSLFSFILHEFTIYKIALVSAFASLILPFFGRIASLSVAPVEPTDAKDGDGIDKWFAWNRERERIRSFVFSLTGALLIFELFLFYYITQNGITIRSLSVSKEAMFPSFLYMTVLAFLAPLMSAVASETIFRIWKVEDTLKEGMDRGPFCGKNCPRKIRR